MIFSERMTLDRAKTILLPHKNLILTQGAWVDDLKNGLFGACPIGLYMVERERSVQRAIAVITPLIDRNPKSGIAYIEDVISGVSKLTAVSFDYMAGLNNGFQPWWISIHQEFYTPGEDYDAGLKDGRALLNFSKG